MLCRSQSMTWDLCQKCTGDLWGPTGLWLQPAVHLHGHVYKKAWINQTQNDLLAPQQEKLMMVSKGRHLNPSSTIQDRPALGLLLQHQAQAELLLLQSQAPHCLGQPSACSASLLPFTVVFVFFPQLVFSVIHVFVHHISCLCVQRKERSPPTQQPCNGWTFPICS